MNSYHDPELEDILQDDELRRVAAVLSSVRSPEPPLDDAFRTSLRRQLMQQAWAMSEGRNSWWRRGVPPSGPPWARAAAGLVADRSVLGLAAVRPPRSPAPVASPRPSPSNALGEKQLASLNGATTLSAQWSADSSSIYFVDGKGQLAVASAKGGAITVIAPDGASSPAISPAGDRLAYIRGGKIEVLTFAAGKTDEIKATPAATLVGWAKDKLVWAAADGIYTEARNGQRQ